MQQTEGWWGSLLPAPAPLPLNDGVIASAVLVPVLSKAGEDHIILTKRASHLSRHAGQISFPGGRIDASDASERAAALREAEEEIALPPTLVEVKGYLPDLYTGTGYRITPVVGRITAAYDEVAPLLQPAPAEVDEMLFVPASHLLTLANYTSFVREHEGRRWTSRRITSGTHVIWGATAAILHGWAGTL